ncbi:hypothetical protein L218DRAFT_941778 [Marasmius fiardii PR-910]|nr:hypothetical protein L218DRAFT_941778 [Marasmius fiardii PR-910]
MRQCFAVLALFVSISSATWQIESFNPGFRAAGRHGCISATSNTDGAPVVIQDCLYSADTSTQDWDFTIPPFENAPPQPLRLFGNKCLDVTGGVNADGTKLQMWTCGNQNPNQLWIGGIGLIYQWAGTNKCIDLTDGNIANGNQLQIWTCDATTSNPNQQFTVGETPPAPPTSGTLAAVRQTHEPEFCLSPSSNSDGASVVLAACTSTTAGLTWALPAVGSGTSGLLSTFNGGKCLDVPGGNSANGNRLQVWTCSGGNANQQWIIDGPRSLNRVMWAGQNKCLDVPNGNRSAGVALQIWDCTPNNINQEWNIQGPPPA